MGRPKDPDFLVPLTSARAEFEAQVIVQALESRGIPATSFSTAGQALQWEIAMTDPIRVMVRRRDLAAARAALREIRGESVDIDWDEVEVGAPEEREPPTPANEGAFAKGVIFIVVLVLAVMVLVRMLDLLWGLVHT